MGKGFWISKHTQAKNSVRKLLSCKHRPPFMKKKPAWVRVDRTRGPRVANMLLGSRNTIWALYYVMMQSNSFQSQQKNTVRNRYIPFLELSLQNLMYFTLNTILIWTNYTSKFSISSVQHVASNYLIRQCRNIPFVSIFGRNCFFYSFFKYMKG